MGLTIAKGFIEAHHGTITARNRTDGGAEFVVRLPITEAVKNSTEEII